MNRRMLGRTGLEVSVLGLGTVKLGRRTGVKYPHPFEIPSDDRVRELLALARELGVNLLDTAPAYGESEERLGRLLAGPRDDWVIVTKAGEEFDGERSRFDFSPEGVVASAERSLRRLRTDHVDLLLVHSDGVIESHLVECGLLGALHDLKRRGLCRAVGVSTKTRAGAQQAIDHTDAVMLTLSPAQRDDLEMVEAARRRGVGVLIKKALDSGHAATPAGGALRSASRVPGVSCVVVGTINPDHLRANVREVQEPDDRG